jgi:hypothetical protein
MPLGSFRLNGLVKRLVAAGFIRTALYGGRTWGTDSFQIHNFSKYGSRSLWFPGITSANFVELGGVADDLKFHIGTKTWEVWVYPTAWTASGSTGEAASNIIGNSGYDGWGYNNFGFNSTGQLRFGYAINNSFSNYQNITESGTSGVLNQWQHIAMTQISGVIRLYHNGTLVAGPTAVASTPTYDFGNQRGFNIGVNGLSFRGYMDDLRISKTARYTGNFTPPAQAHTNDADTVVLYHWDNAAVINPAGGFPSGWDDGGEYSPGTTPTSVTAVSLIDAVYSTTTSITVPAFARVDDYAILFDSSTNTTNVVPSGWTEISNTTTSGIRSVISYKKLVIGDVVGGVTVSGLTGSSNIARKTLVIVRPNAPVSSVFISTAAPQATNAVPTNQTLSMSGQTMPLMGFAHYASTGAISTRTGASNERELVNTTRQYVRNWTHNITTPANQTIGMSDGGTNTLQNFWIRFIP